MANVSVRYAEPDDAQAIYRMLSGPRATAGTLQLPLQSVEGVRKRFFSETREGLYHLVACTDVLSFSITNKEHSCKTSQRLALNRRGVRKPRQTLLQVLLCPV